MAVAGCCRCTTNARNQISALQFVEILPDKPRHRIHFQNFWLQFGARSKIAIMLAAQPLTPRQERFVGAYTSNVAMFNAAKSCRLAGYSEKSCRDTGYENLRKPHIRLAITQRFEAAFDSNELTIDKVLQDLEMVRRVSIRKGDLRVALRAIELQGKYLGMFSTRFKAIGETQTYEEASDVELVQMLVEFLSNTRLAPEILLPLRAALDPN